MFLKQSPETAMLSGAPTHLPLSHPFCLSRTYLQRSLQEVTSQDKSFMPDISSYIRERVKDKNPYLLLNSNGSHRLKKTHNCHYQIQVQLATGNFVTLYAAQNVTNKEQTTHYHRAVLSVSSASMLRRVWNPCMDTS